MDHAELLVVLLERAGVDARMAMGLRLQDARRRQSLVPMVEVYTGERWLLFNPRTGETGVPENQVGTRIMTSNLRDSPTRTASGLTETSTNG